MFFAFAFGLDLVSPIQDLLLQLAHFWVLVGGRAALLNQERGEEFRLLQ
jgi:hypothetical protein